MEDVELTIIGAGVIGLSIAAELSGVCKDILVLEKNSSFGQETSSRNSEVIHSGIYYPKDSLKAKTCIEGNHLLYELCGKFNIPHKKIGKLIVACVKEEIEDLEKLLDNAKLCGVEGLRLISAKELENLEPNVKALCGLYSGHTGIVDSHRLMEYFQHRAKENSTLFAYNTEVKAIEKLNSGYKVVVKDANQESFSFKTKVLLNSSGLNSDLVASLVGIDIDKFDLRLKYCKGQYFRVNSKKAELINHLVYPVPKPKSGGLGIHATKDLTNGLRLGPDDTYLNSRELDYSVDLKRKDVFYQSVKECLPFIEPNDLSADIAGIRPKLQGKDEEFRDFVIQDETDKGLPGFINLIGIESPGLTSALAIAKYVGKSLDK